MSTLLGTKLRTVCLGLVLAKLQRLPLLLLIWNYFQSIKQRIRPFGWCTHGIKVNALATPGFEIKLRLLASLASSTFVDSIKHLKICSKCSSIQVSPGYILPCLGLTRQDLALDPLLVQGEWTQGPLLTLGMRNNKEKRLI
ncbi:hypothetical protein TNCV_3545081 [Trichonephila clavipes]|uniref:Uncharacterized protein n=1 Tax=Trichonephila clavipes TaxID=2585209 RepID=A0A8X6RJ37_TRICX|nr:hypothetical protein TNCV_3545081 [Trichonephila clavipes]